jgi:hypothetical protein
VKVSRQPILVNVSGNNHYNLFTRPLLGGRIKKAILVASNSADLESINSFEIETSSLYAMSKVAVTVVTAKFSA